MSRVRSNLDKSLLIVTLVLGTALAWKINGLRLGPAPQATLHDSVPDLVGGSILVGRGPKSVVIFSDYECLACRLLEARIDSLAPNVRPLIRVRHVPGPNRLRARDAAKAAECAAEQNRFHPFHDLIFDSQDTLATVSWISLAVQAGIADTTRFAMCLGSDSPRTRVARDKLAGQQAGITSTPSIIADRKVHVGAVSARTLKTIMER